MQHANLDVEKRILYETISYWWGEDGLRAEVEVNEQAINVPQNCTIALQKMSVAAVSTHTRARKWIHSLAPHETVHYSTIGPESSLDEQSIDAKNPGDLDYAYFPKRTHGLIDDDQDDRSDLPPENANSYAWMALTA
ncbi:hypothetical protein AC579_1840 [Pseudocercospora musae]|uniref:Uncharacterized protein n=1 Tax=Pseudocercospora musae TaxID=113226 RepID=A0A139I837_9PEZI|nr:hypothetical protein AC579_1840 [Pseudocercospora musae]